MALIHNLGFPRIGAKRELKFALEAYWQGETNLAALKQTGAALRARHWGYQAGLDLVPVGDFSFYDQVLDTSFLLGHLPARVREFTGDPLDNYFRLARGRSAHVSAQTTAAGTQALTDTCCHHAVVAGEMTKWFDTNYHYIVPEFSADSRFALNADALLAQIAEARAAQVNVKPVLIGPLTYLALGKSKDQTDPLSLLPKLLPVYRELLQTLSAAKVQWVQIDEPVLAKDLTANWQQAFAQAYQQLDGYGVQLLLTSYFGPLQDNLQLACQLPVQGVHLDLINAQAELPAVLAALGRDKVLSLGVINGRNIWKTDLTALLDLLEPIAADLGSRLWLAPSCSLLHVPVDLSREKKLPAEVKNWLAFACEKLAELQLLGRALKFGRAAVAAELADNAAAINARRSSTLVHNPAVQAALAAVNTNTGQRLSPYPVRAHVQQQQLQLPALPTTTIGSFPQTAQIRQARSRFKAGELDLAAYQQAMQAEIAYCVQMQEQLGLDVLVHGEAERNDMVEYFGEQLEGYVFSQAGWVQSYGSRCVKPPIIVGDISRKAPMTVEWTRYAQSLTEKPMKGMLTGPVTMLNWSFVRDDQPRSLTCLQLALAVRAEVLDLEAAGVQIIQIDEAALREGLPLRRADWEHYLQWAVAAFRVCANGVQDQTQIHTHMCYSDFNDIIAAIAQMDADVITIETARSDMALLAAFEHFEYPNAIGPGVYDIHSPNIPTVAQMVSLLQKAAQQIPLERLWVNPDCGLKTRKWPEVLPALERMVAAAKQLRLSR